MFPFLEVVLYILEYFPIKKSKPFELGFLFYVCLRFRLFIEERILSCVTDFLIG